MVKVLPKMNKRNRLAKKLIPFSLYNRNLTYRKLPQQQLLKLSVLKLDGSSFSLHVARNATVAGLKSAVEEEFNLFSKEESTKLWALVWSHFCLCYEGQKLIHDLACIQKYGIKDGDQLRFIQHLRVDLQHRSIPRMSLSSPDTVQCKTDHHNSEDECAKLRYFQLALPESKSRLTASLKGLLRLEIIKCWDFENVV